ncbi:MAG: hypothetical protein ABI853_00120 [Sphingomicrobium sp.]
MILMPGTLVVVAGAMQVAVPVLRVPPAVTRPPNAAIAPSTAIQANILPDLVVSEVRIEDDHTAHIRITNQGTADAKGWIQVESSVSKGYHRGYTLPAWVNDLAAGESKWVTSGNYVDRDETFVPGKDMSMPLSTVTGFSATVDPGAPPQSMEDYLLQGKSPCTAQAGCIRELDETNNNRGFTADQIGHGKPD